MTVYIEKPAVNLREELASLRNQGGYEERQFYFDNVVTNGTFDTNTTGWTGVSSTLSTVSGVLRITSTSGTSYAQHNFAIEAGKVYSVSADVSNIGGSKAQLWIGSAYGLANWLLIDNVTTASTITGTFTATTSSAYLELVGNTTTGQSTDWDNISVFEADGTDVVHRMPKGWVPLHVYEDGLLQREGAANDYEVVYDGFDYYVKPAVAPSATTQTCVIGVRK